jgi:hypothetical protein
VRSDYDDVVIPEDLTDESSPSVSADRNSRIILHPSPTRASSTLAGTGCARKPILCVQTFARSRLACIMSALRRQRRVSRYAATLRSMVCRYDYLDSYATELQEAVEQMIRTGGGGDQSGQHQNKTALLSLQRTASSAIRPSSAQARGPRAADPSPVIDTDALYKASVYYRRDEHLHPGTRRPFSAGKIRAHDTTQRLGQRIDSFSGNAMTMGTHSRPVSAMSRESDPPSTHAVSSQRPPQLLTTSKRDVTLRMDAASAAVEHWAHRRSLVEQQCTTRRK